MTYDPHEIEAEIRKAAGIAEPIFRREDWRWCMAATGEGAVPTYGQIITTLQRLVATLITTKEKPEVSCGRFTVSMRDNDVLDIRLDLGHVYGRS